MEIYTIYDGIIERHTVIRKTKTGYRVANDEYETGMQVTGFDINDSTEFKHHPHDEVNYVTESRAAAIKCAESYVVKMIAKTLKVQETIESFSN